MTPIHLILFFLLLIFLLAFVHVGIFTLALDKLGVSSQSAFTILFASLLGSGINLPLRRVPSASAPGSENWPSLPYTPRYFIPGTTLIAINVGGALIPVLVSLYLLRLHALLLGAALLCIAIVALISFHFSRPIRGIGIGMPILIAPLAAALTALLVDPQHSAPLAYIGGTLGVLVGADLFRLKDIRQMAPPVASIGGAGTFDGIFITGIVAVLLA
ncbi:MAG: DUF1614 domain-containing protein [Gammaproteobacteria bacterium]